MTKKELNKQYEERYQNEIKAGATIEINHSLPYVAIKINNGDEYFFQDEEASNLLKEVPDYINEEVYIIAIAQNW